MADPTNALSIMKPQSGPDNQGLPLGDPCDVGRTMSEESPLGYVVRGNSTMPVLCVLPGTA